MSLGRPRGSRWRGRLARLAAVCAAYVACAPLAAQRSDVPDQPPRLAIDPFDRGVLGVEFNGAVFREAWNFNEATEWLVDGGAAVWWTYLDGAMLVVEFHATRVFQRSSRDGFVNSLNPVLRWRVVGRPSWQLFADVGSGISWSDTVVPPRGTRFNYVALAGAGLMRRLGRQTHAVASFRWVHLSNAGREGRSRNPDIEALGGFAGVVVAF
jgi:hypothetical protein